MQLDPWQEEVMKTKGNLVLRSGRQVGKSTVIALKAAKFALENPNKLIMIISKTERQAGLLFTKILLNIHNINKVMIMKGKDRPTKQRIRLKNKSVIHCLPAGDTGYGIMGFTIDLLIADEAAFIPEEVWASITPALAITRGIIWLLSTPKLKEGYYYRCFEDPEFTSFHTSSEDCPRKDDKFLDYQKGWMTNSQYAQMYLGEFVDDLMQFFKEDLIIKCCTFPRSKKGDNPPYPCFLGVDIARMGEDDSTFEILHSMSRTKIKQIEHISTSKTKLTDTADKIKELDTKYKFGRKSIGIDDAGLGAGVFDFLLRDNQVGRKIIGLSNARKAIDREEREKKLMKEDMYNNLRTLMESGQIELLDDDEVKASLRSIHAEHDKVTGRLKLWGSDSHIAEGLIRAAYLAKNKSLNIMAFCK